MHACARMPRPDHQPDLPCVRLIEERATKNPLLQQQLGAPLSTGKWYNSSVGVSHRGFVGTATIAVVGSHNSSDVIITVRDILPMHSRNLSRSDLLYILHG
jgi:hypothetical protein